MKAVILAGGYGTRISEETHLKPKPMIEIGGRPIIWHIMKIYSYFGINEFVICCGYKGYLIKEYFANYSLHCSDVTFHIDENKLEFHNRRTEKWKVTLVDTGEDSQTGGRILRVKDYVKGTFCLTYGDGVTDLNIKETLDFHFKHGKLATLTAVQPLGRWGALTLKDNNVEKFQEKLKGDNSWINGGFFVLEPAIFDLIDNDYCIWEQEPLKELAKKKELMSYKHNGFWHPMDTMRDKKTLEDLWSSKSAPWKIWND